MRAPPELQAPPPDSAGKRGEAALQSPHSSNSTPENTPNCADRQADLMAEFAAAAARAQEADTHKWLCKALCVSETVLSGINPDYPPGHPWRARAALVGVQRIEVAGDRYQPGEDGKPALIVPVAEHYDPAIFQPVDLIAFFPSRPGAWYVRRGVADVLGADAIRRAVFRDEPLIVRPDPLLWLQTGAADCVVLDWRAATFALGSVRRVVCATPELGRRLAKAFQIRGPEIRVIRHE